MSKHDQPLEHLRRCFEDIKISTENSLKSNVEDFLSSLLLWRKILFPDIGNPELPFSDPEILPEENPLDWPTWPEFPKEIKKYKGYKAIGLIVYTGEAKLWEASLLGELNPNSWWRYELMKQGFEDLRAVWGKEDVIDAASPIVKEIEHHEADTPTKVSKKWSERTDSFTGWAKRLGCGTVDTLYKLRKAGDVDFFSVSRQRHRINLEDYRHVMGDPKATI